MSTTVKQSEEQCRLSKQNAKPNGPGYCIPSPNECEECRRFQQMADTMTRYPYHCFNEVGTRKFYEGRYWNTCGKGIAIVAVVTENVDWAAYIGSDNGQSEGACLIWTAENGAKLREVDAKYYFPEIELTYRG